jgi:serine protease AprX
VLAVGAPTVAAAPPVGSTTSLLSIIDPSTTPAQVSAAVTARGGTVLDVYEVADAVLVSLPAGSTAPAGTVAVPDVALHVTSSAATAAADLKGATYRTTIDVPASATGAGVTVALVDTGVADVADLAGRVHHVNVSGGAAGDGLGHGTFVAGLIAGNGRSSHGTYTGVAPDAEILDVQVATADGSTSLVRVLAGLQVVANSARVDRTLKVVSLALSTGNPLPPQSDPLARALDRLWARGLTVVVAAGNDGPDDATVHSPGADPTLITVGSLDEHATSARADDTVNAFSSRGTQFGTDKPDLVAPGTSLISTRAPGSSADLANPQSRVGDAYFTGSGTSMAEAVTAGAVAVLLDTRPSLTPDAIKTLLVRDAYDADGLTLADGAGAGGLDLGAAVAAAPTMRVRHPARAGAFRVFDAYGPSPADAAAWQAFQDAWTAGDLEAVAAAWSDLSPQTRRWAATAFAQALLVQNPGMDADEYAALTEMARSWATQAWNARSWATDAFVARSWAARSWAARSWAIDDWAARSWADSSFTARSWALQDWSARSWADAQFAARSWAARSWSATDWSARSWAQMDWLAFAWVARSWAARSWAAEAWTNQAWSARSWSARSWADFSWAARSWAVDGWSARSWAADTWGDAA